MNPKEVKIIANYLPQYHCIPENDMWWGKGYTDWEAVKKSRPLFKGHRQPRIPLGRHYYSLDSADEIKWQCVLAKEYGIDGFGIYHYWFNSNLHLLDKPVLLLYEHKEINMPFFLIWDNGSWRRTWSNVKSANDWAPLFENEEKNASHQGNGLLAELNYGDEGDWKIHFDYLLPLFKDKRYIKIDNKPVFAFFNPNNSPEIIIKMISYWNELAKENGFDGIYDLANVTTNTSITTKRFFYNPSWSGWQYHNSFERIKNKLHKEIAEFRKTPELFDYDKIWKNILNDSARADSDIYLSGFVSYDDTPRRGRRGRIVLNENPQKFGQYMKKLIQLSAKQNKDFVFITAWNEWGEGAYLEPDEDYKFEFLKALKEAKEIL